MNSFEFIAFGAICLAVFLHVFFKIYARRTAAIEEYQNSILKELKWLSEQDDVDAEMLRLACSVARVAQMSNSTLFVLGTLIFGGKSDSKKTSSLYLQDCSIEIKRSMARVVFDMLKVVSLRSILWGWLVFPIVLSEPRQKTIKSHSKIGIEGLIYSRAISRFGSQC